MRNFVSQPFLSKKHDFFQQTRLLENISAERSCFIFLPRVIGKDSIKHEKHPAEQYHGRMFLIVSFRLRRSERASSFSSIIIAQKQRSKKNYLSVKTSTKPVISKTSLTRSQTFVSVKAPIIFLCVESSTRSPAEDT